MYICVKLTPGDLNLNTCPLHLTNIYTYEVITAQRMRDDKLGTNNIPTVTVRPRHLAINAPIT